MPAFFQIL